MSVLRCRRATSYSSLYAISWNRWRATASEKRDSSGMAAASDSRTRCTKCRYSRVRRILVGEQLGHANLQEAPELAGGPDCLHELPRLRGELRRRVDGAQ